MILTNKLDLPQPIYDAIANDTYTSGDADISVTSLLKPPRQVALERIHADDLTEDASDKIWSLVGQVIHGILERADKSGIAERRLSIVVDGWKISGGMDRYIDGKLQDYKFVTAYKFKDVAIPIEYVQQLNIYSEILRQNGHPVHSAEIVGILRDWSKMEARREANYPQTQVVIREIPLWTREHVQAFLLERVQLHKAARIELPLCSDEERWARPTKWAVTKKGAKKALKLHLSKDAAAAHAGTDKIFHVEVRPGENVKCNFYCSVSQFCTQKSEMEKLNGV